MLTSMGTRLMELGNSGKLAVVTDTEKPGMLIDPRLSRMVRFVGASTRSMFNSSPVHVFSHFVDWSAVAQLSAKGLGHF